MSDFLEQLKGLDLPAGVLEQLRDLVPKAVAHRDTLLFRLALPRTFTRKLYELAADGLTSPPPFEGRPGAFVDLPEVERVPSSPGRYAIRDQYRSKLLPDWVKDPDRKKWAGAYLAALDPKNEVEVLDRLQLLFWFDQAKGREALSQTFNSADTSNDIPRATALVQLVAPVVSILGDDRDTRTLVNGLRARVQARNIFFAEWLQSERYFPRDAIERELNEFLEKPASSNWILHIHGTGGMGKTTILRRLLTHKWILGERRFNCAWLDFDYLDVDAVLQAPAILSLPMAAQWNEQLVDPLFGSLLEPSFATLAPVLFRPRADGEVSGLGNNVAEQVSRAQYRGGRSNPMRCGVLAGVVPPASEQERTQRLTSARYLRVLWDDKFPHLMTDLPTDRPVVLMIDTIEEASVRYGRDLMEILRLIGSLREKVRKLQPKVDLRLILSGRYELGQKSHVPEFAASATDGGFEGQYRSVPVPPFENKEAVAFLSTCVPEPQHGLIPAMVKKSLGIPFNLSLFGEWAEADPGLTEETILKSEDISTVMLIERIIKRIPQQPLRWIIRYGVVPRVLTLEFLSEVMRGPLENALLGRSQQDGRDLPNQDEWACEPGFVFDAERLWRESVQAYASSKGWMNLADGQGGAVEFRSDIRNPVRQLLRKQKIFVELHLAARSWYEERASKAANGDLWAAAQVEYLYHKLQLRFAAEDDRETAAVPPRMIDAIRQVLEAPLVVHNAALRKRMLEQLRSEDFAQFSSAELAYVEWRLAEATAAAAGYGYAQAVAPLARAFALAGDQAGEILPPFAHEWNRVSEQRAAVSMLLPRLSSVPPDDAVQLSMLMAEFSGTRSEVTADVLESALKICTRLPRSTVPLSAVQDKLGRYYLNRAGSPDPESAVPLFKSAADGYLQFENRNQWAEMLRQIAKAHLSLGRVYRAEGALEPCRSISPPNPSIEIQLVRIDLMKGETGRALDRLGRLQELGLSEAQSLEALLLYAEALSLRGLWRDASGKWQEASDRAQRISNVSAVVRSHLGQIRLEYGIMRRIEVPGALYPPAIRSMADPGQTDELDVWQMFLQPDPAQAERRVFGQMGGSSAVSRVRIRCLLSHLAPALPAEFWKTFLEDVQHIPVPARILALIEPALLTPRNAARHRPEIPEEFRRAIAEAFQASPEGSVESAWHAVRYGELLAWLGYFEEAQSLLRDKVRRPRLPAAEEWQLRTYRERRRIELRLEFWGAKVQDAGPDLPDFWNKAWPEWHFLAAAATIENATWAAYAGSMAASEAGLELARSALSEVPFQTLSHVLADGLRTLKRASPGWKYVSRGVDLAPITGQVLYFGLESLNTSATEFEILTVQPQAGRLAVRSSISPGKEKLVSCDGQSLEIMLRASGNVPRRLVGLRPQDLFRDLREILTQSATDLDEKNLMFRTPAPSLSAAPWEGAMAKEDGWLYRLPSGPADSKFPGAPRLPTPRSRAPIVRMVVPETGQLKESPEIEAYMALAREWKAVSSIPLFVTANVLYVAAHFAEPSGLFEPTIGDITASNLARLLASEPRSVATNKASHPMVILDVPACRSDTDYIHQLLLRNCFAQILIDSGSVTCVLATGLWQGNLRAEMHDAIQQRLREPAIAQSELFEQLQAIERRSSPYPCTALFTSQPMEYFFLGTGE